MFFRKKNNRRLKQIKEKCKKIGSKSIHDIIHNTPELTFLDKVNWIRHKYSYYEGNYEFFHNKFGKPNKLKYELNYLIGNIINGKADASELKIFNKKILKLRKEVNAKLENEKTIALNNVILPINNKITKKAKWEREIENNKDTAQFYITLINEFLINNDYNLSEDKLFNLSYKEIKNMAIDWKNNQNKEKIEQKYAEEKMRSYAQHLGYIK